MSTQTPNPIADETEHARGLTVAELVAVVSNDTTAFADAGKVEVPAAIAELRRLANNDGLDGPDPSPIDVADAVAAEAALTALGIDAEAPADVAGESAQDGDPETETPKTPKKDGSYTVFKQLSPTTFEVIATEVAAKSDLAAIDQSIAPDTADQTFFAVPRWVGRTPKIESKPVRKWA